MLTSELSELAAVVERIRAEAYPHLDKTFIDAVLSAEAGAAGQEGAALTAIRAALEATLESAAD
jgi:hypothetical protein